MSAVSVWEIAIKALLGKLRLTRPLDALEAAIEASGFAALAVSLRHAAAVAAVSVPHADPFDRLLLAQCEVESLRLLTADRILKGHPAALPLPR